MRQIFQLEEKELMKYQLDPVAGLVKRSEHVIQPTSTIALSHNGQTFELEDDQTFHVPDDVADAFLRMPGWHEGENPFNDIQDAAPVATAPKGTRGRKPKADAPAQDDGGKGESKD